MRLNREREREMKRGCNNSPCNDKIKRQTGFLTLFAALIAFKKCKVSDYSDGGGIPME